MIVLVLSCLKCWCTEESDTVPLRATSYVSVPIDWIKAANAKLIEREYLIEINANKDSIINNQKQYIDIIETDLYNQLDINNQLIDDVNNVTKQRNITSGVAITAIAAFILSIIF